MRRISDGTWSFRMRGAIDDARVSSLRSRVEGSDKTGLSALDFDVLAASCLVDNETVPPAPQLSIRASNDEVAGHLKEYCRKIDRIWSFFGGCGAERLPALAIWMIRNREAVGAFDGLPMVCAAYVYGETELSLQLLAEWERHWQERMRSEGDQVVEEFDMLWFTPSRQSLLEVGTAVLANIARLRGIIDRSELH